MDSIALRDALTRLALSHRWTWSPELRRVFASLDGGELNRHPIAIVGDATTDALDVALGDTEIMELVSSAIEHLDGADEVTRTIAYFSPEFGVSGVIPQFSGGLGILAGDHLKAASDLNLPLAAVGLFYHEGFFRQSIEDGVQAERYPAMTAEEIGAVDTGHVVQVPMPERDVHARVWRMDIGSTPLLLLDTDLAANSAADRKITNRLYGGDRRHRLEQELLLGVGGVRALRAVGWPISVYHLNEGHAGFLVLALIDETIEDEGLAVALQSIKKGLVFTTHTPVPAGIDRFDRSLITPYLEVWSERWDVDLADLWELGADPERVGKFNMAAMGLRTASAANGVSKLHGEVSRKLFAGVGIGDEIGHITNGVHARTWVSEDNQAVFDRVLGSGWSEGSVQSWNKVDALTDAAVGALRHIGSLRLSQMVQDAVGARINPEALVVGFARRFATYKRATLLFNELDRLQAMLNDDDRPIHFVFAGKAHPADVPGKALLAKVVEFANSEESNGRFTFVPDYGIDIARHMYEGSDVWLNTPVRPREASGTSGEKAALNGGLNCSILDGWWAEMFDGQNGWAIPASEAEDPLVRDAAEAAATLDVLDAILAEYHDSPVEFVGRIRHAWRTLGPQVTAARMVSDYRDEIYGPALQRAI
ncbi:MAG: alpha-glucan family phosphorylase [Acidimicrobiia bacterium]|nr:alpha-glucan family phosphorylase [Acidimicrobiia bacterium]